MAQDRHWSAILSRPGLEARATRTRAPQRPSLKALPPDQQPDLRRSGLVGHDGTDGGFSVSPSVCSVARSRASLSWSRNPRNKRVLCSVSRVPSSARTRSRSSSML
jgi:hypothetical protein